MSESSDSPPPDTNSNSPPPSDQGGGSGSQNTSQSQSPPSQSNSNSSPPSPPSSPPPSGGGSAPAPKPKSESPPPSSSPPPKESAPPTSSPAPKSSPPPPSPPPSPPPPSSPPPSLPSKSSPPASPPPNSRPPSSSSSSSSPPPPHSPPPSSTHNNSSGSSGNTQSPLTSPASRGSASESPPSPVSPSTTPPATPGTPVAKTNPNPTKSPANVLSPPTGSSSGASHAPPRSSSNTVAPAPSNSNETGTHTRTIVGLTVAGVFVLALVAFIFLCIKKKKRQSRVYPPNYMPPPHGANLLDGYYHGQQPSSGNSGPPESYFTNGHPPPISSFENSYGSQRERGNAYGCAGVGESGLITATKVHFCYEELMEITNGFSRQNILGEGGFGCVYKGWLPEGKAVAVKQLKAGSGQGEKEFRAEVEIISRVHHRHLVSLVGYCISEQQRLLIYEFVPNTTLEHHLHGTGVPVLEWTKRHKIALGSAKGLAYLHEDCHPKIIHRDIKSANILLDDAFEAQVADFGLAKLTNDTNTHVSTRVMGTFGYMAPEYANSGKLTDRSDVFSFGVVLLELVTGRKPVDPTQPLGDESLVEWARPLLIQALETGDLSQLVDRRLEKHYVEGEMFRMVEAAAACVRHSAAKRPRMAQVVRALDCESDLTNGVKVGQSTAYDSGQYNEDIMRFRRMALGSESSSEYEMSSSEFSSRDVSGPRSTWTRPDGSSGESETRAFNTGGGEQRFNGSQSRRF